MEFAYQTEKSSIASSLNLFFTKKEMGLTKDKGTGLHNKKFIEIDIKRRITGVYNGTLKL